MALLRTQDIGTTTTAASTELDDGFILVSIQNLDGTNTVVVSVEEAVTASSAGRVTLQTAGSDGATDTLDVSKIPYPIPVDTIYHDASAGTPTIRVIGYIA